MSFRAALACSFLSVACGASSAPSSTRSPEGGASPHPAHAVPCTGHGLYALPALPEGAAEDKLRAIVDEFARAEEEFERGEPSRSWRSFLAVAQKLSALDRDRDLGDWARLSRELAYHDALWAAAAAEELDATRAVLEKAAGSDAALAEAIKTMLADAPLECGGK